MHDGAPLEPPFDPRWLDLLAEHCAARSTGSAPVLDLYLERHLELRVRDDGAGPQVEHCLGEGSSLRWCEGPHEALKAVSGSSPLVLADLLAGAGAGARLATARPLQPPDIDPPRGWRRWAAELVQRMRALRPEVVFLKRRAAVVRAEGWVAVEAPPLLRVHALGPPRRALLSVWGHPALGDWLGALRETSVGRFWRPPSGARVPVLFAAGTGGGVLHELVGHFCEADLVSSGDSPLASLVGATIGPDSLQVVDDPSRWDLPGAFSADDEGVEATARTLIERGRLTGFLCHRAGARALGQAPGRGRRGAWNLVPQARMSNLLVGPGTEDPEAMERSVAKGLVVTRLAGATVDPNSGRAVIHVELGFELRNGRRRRPLEALNLSGHALDILRGLDAGLGNDPTPDWRLGWCLKNGAAVPTGSEAPTLLVHELEVL